MQRSQTVDILVVSESGYDLSDAAWNTGTGAMFNFNPFLDANGGDYSGYWKIYGELVEEYEHESFNVPMYGVNALEFAGHKIRHQRLYCEYNTPTGFKSMDIPLDPEDQDPGDPMYGFLGGPFDINNPSVLNLTCGVSGSGYHNVSASFLGQTLSWGSAVDITLNGIYDGTDDSWYFGYPNPGAPNDQTICTIDVNSTGASTSCTHGGDEAFAPIIQARWQLPHKVRVLVDPKDDLGNSVTGKKVWIGFMPLIPENADSPDYDSSDIGDYIVSRTTPVDETFNFPLQLVRRYISANHQRATWTTKPMPLPPLLNVDSLSKRDWYSGLSCIGVAVDRAEIGMSTIARPWDAFSSMTSQRREIAPGRFHSAAEVTNMEVATLTLASTKSLPTLTWAASGTGASVSANALTAGDAEGSFAAAVSGFDARPYRYLRFDAQATEATSGWVELSQGTLLKGYLFDVDKGTNSVLIDTSNPFRIVDSSFIRERGQLPMIEGGNQALPASGEVVRECFTGVGPVSEVKIRFSASTITVSNFRVGVERFAEMRPMGYGLLSQVDGANDDDLHTYYGRIDGRDAFRVKVSTSDDVKKVVDNLCQRQGLTVSGENYAFPTWWKQYDSWQQIYTSTGGSGGSGGLDEIDGGPGGPGGGGSTPTKKVPTNVFKFFSNFDNSLQRPNSWAGMNPVTGAKVRMTLLGQGIKVFPGIGQDTLFRTDLGNPFRAEFEFLWGSNVSSTTAFGPPASTGTIPEDSRTYAKMKVERVTGVWNRDYITEADAGSNKEKGYGRYVALPMKSPSDSTRDVKHYCTELPAIVTSMYEMPYGGSPTAEIPKETLYLNSIRQMHWVGIAEDFCRAKPENLKCDFQDEQGHSLCKDPDEVLRSCRNPIQSSMPVRGGN